MTPQTEELSLRCEISRGAFSSERVFRVKLADQQIYAGAAPVNYCYSKAGQPLAQEQPSRGKLIEGRIIARLIRDEEDGTRLVAVPDGGVLRVTADQITDLPSKFSSDVPVQS